MSKKNHRITSGKVKAYIVNVVTLYISLRLVHLAIIKRSIIILIIAFITPFVSAGIVAYLNKRFNFGVKIVLWKEKDK